MTRIVGTAIVTLALGISVFVAWSLALGRLAGTGPGTVLRDQPLMVAGLVGLLAAVVGAGLVLLTGQRWTIRMIAAVIAVAWAGELVVLVVAGRLIANEIEPAVAPWLWLTATVGPVQPLAAIAGAWLARTARQSPRRNRLTPNGGRQA